MLRDLFYRGAYDIEVAPEGHKVWLRFRHRRGFVYLLVDVTTMVVVTVYNQVMWNNMTPILFREASKRKPTLVRQNHRLHRLHRR